MPRRLGWIAAVLILVRSVAAIYSQAAPFNSSRIEGWKLAQDLIQESTARRSIPKFVAWETTREIFPCSGRTPAARVVSTHNLLDESFHYSPEAAARMCEPLAPTTGAVPSTTTLRFPDGAHLAAAFWNAVRRPVDPQNGKIVQMAIRTGNDVHTRKIRITLPKSLGKESAACDPPTSQGDPAAADAAEVSLKEFFWVRLNPGERYNGASCGDFAVLMAFHLVHKVRGRWLWTTFWWDPESKEFGADRPKDFAGAGVAPGAWRNYAMDASFESTAIIFNPWRIEERKDNCARCHAEVTVYKSRTSDAQINFDSVTAARNHFQ